MASADVHQHLLRASTQARGREQTRLQAQVSEGRDFSAPFPQLYAKDSAHSGCSGNSVD